MGVFLRRIKMFLCRHRETEWDVSAHVLGKPKLGYYWSRCKICGKYVQQPFPDTFQYRVRHDDRIV